MMAVCSSSRYIAHARSDKTQHLLGVHAAELGCGVVRCGHLAIRPNNEFRGLHDAPTLAFSSPAAQYLDEIGVYTVCDWERKLMAVGNITRLRITLCVASDYTYSRLKKLAIALLYLGQLPSAVRSPSSSVEKDIDP